MLPKATNLNPIRPIPLNASMIIWIEIYRNRNLFDNKHTYLSLPLLTNTRLIIYLTGFFCTHQFISNIN